LRLPVFKTSTKAKEDESAILAQASRHAAMHAFYESNTALPPVPLGLQLCNIHFGRLNHIEKSSANEFRGSSLPIDAVQQLAAATAGMTVMLATADKQTPLLCG
jgi:hypothetical protein